MENSTQQGYMDIATKVRKSLRHGDIVAYLRVRTQVNRTTLSNTLNGYYYQKGKKVEYQNVLLLNDLAQFIIHRRGLDKELLKSVAILENGT